MKSEKHWFTRICEHISFCWLAFWSAVGMLAFVVVGAPLVAFLKGWNMMFKQMNEWVKQYMEEMK